jgi:putative mRNA 3-end processing factor
MIAAGRVNSWAKPYIRGMSIAIPKPESWVRVVPGGLYVEPGQFFIDPTRPVERAVITHGHADHARPGNKHVLATPGTLAIMRTRYGDGTGAAQALDYNAPIEINGVRLWLAPAGHVLGSAQAVIEWQGCRVVVSGDYKRRFDPTCTPFEVVPCDVFITEATFGLPVFRHPPDSDEIDKVLRSLALFPERAHLIGVYALGKCQRVIALLRRAGYDRPIYIHGALVALCGLYQRLGVDLGELRLASEASRDEFKGQIVLSPPSASSDRWSRRLPDPITAVASGWMRVRQRARQRGVELPLVISDHADWDELLRTIEEVEASEIWVTHGREEALIHAAGLMGKRARALALVGYEDDED